MQPAVEYGARSGNGFACRQARRASACGGQAFGRLLGRQEARAAVHHHGVGNAGFRQVELGLEHFELDADTARLAPQHELRIGEGQAIGVGLKGDTAIGVGLQLSPGIGQRRSGGELDVFGGFHGLLF